MWTPTTDSYLKICPAQKGQYVVLVSANYLQDTHGNFDATAPEPVSSKDLVEIVFGRQH
jgi:hypothetical protein